MKSGIRESILARCYGLDGRERRGGRSGKRMQLRFLSGRCRILGGEGG